MGSRNERRLYRSVDAALFRVAVQPCESSLPPWPVSSTSEQARPAEWAEWLRLAWALPRSAEAVEFASPVLASRIEAVIGGAEVDGRRARRMALALARYLLRAGSRATPYGLFAGVAPAGFGSAARVRVGDGHVARLRPDAQWLDAVITGLESDPELLADLFVMTSTLCREVGSRLRIAVPAGDDGVGQTEVSLRLTPAVALALDVARSPLRAGDLAGKVAAGFPTVAPEKINGLIAMLVAQRVLVSSLRAPLTVPDPLEYLLAQLDALRISRLASVLGPLREIHTGIQALGSTAVHGPIRASCRAVVERMRGLAPVSAAPLAVDLRVDARVTLPWAVAREAETAAGVLARLAAYPHGTPAWRQYADRFARRYGAGALVAVTEVTDPVVGLGFPPGYTGAAAESPPSRTRRDELLLTYAQRAALEGITEVVLTEPMITELQTAAGSPHGRVPPHLEVNIQVLAESVDSLAREEFTLRMLGVSRAVGTMTGRFLPLLESADQARMTTVLAGLPTVDPAAVAVQLSFAPLRIRADHVVRAPRVLPSLISVGEFAAPGEHAIPVEDLAVGCGEDGRLYLVSLSGGQVVEPMVPTSLNYRVAANTSPLGRFLAELARANVAQVTGFDWGLAATLPFLPALRYGRVILMPARWKLGVDELPGPGASAGMWTEALHAWRARRRMPARVLLAQGDQQLLLDLDQDGPRDLLRAQLDREERATLIDAVRPDDLGWIGGRAHSLVVPLISTEPPAAALTSRSAARRRPERGDTPWVIADLFVHPDVQDEVLVQLPRLVTSFDVEARWWFERDVDPEPLLRLGFGVAGAEEVRSVAGAVGGWTADLHVGGLVRGVQLTTRSAHTGRWGDGEALEAAERLFRADSQVAIGQLGGVRVDSRPALAAANFVGLAVGFIGRQAEAMNWFVERGRSEQALPLIPRSLRDEAVHLANPTDNFAAVHAALGGRVMAGWRERAEALAAYRTAGELVGRDPDATLTALLHSHAARVFGPDGNQRRMSLRLARAAALVYRHAEGRP